MQNTKQVIESKKSVAFTLLERGLQDLLREKFTNKEYKVIAKHAGVSMRTCRRYIFEKKAPDFEIGKKVLASARKYIIEREQSIKKMLLIPEQAA